MLTKLPLPAAICIFLLTATIAAVTTTNTTTTTKTTKTPPAARVNGVAESTTARGKATTTAEITTNGNGSKSVSRSRSQQDVDTTPLDKQKFGNKISAVSEGVRRAETTTSLLPLQPPLNVTSTTTSNFLTPKTGNKSARHQQASTVATQFQPTKSQPTSASATNSTARSSLTRAFRPSNVNVGNVADVVRNDSNTLQHDSAQKDHPKVVELVPAPVVEIYNENETSSNADINKTLRQEPKKSEYIHFDIHEADASIHATAAPTRATRMETVNEVLSNLFPNGFTDIFRFSYASEQPTPTSIATADAAETSQATSETTPEAKQTTAPGSTVTAVTTTTEKNKETPTKALYRYETSVSKEYRRELRPGHTEIVVEKLQLLPRGANVGSDEFSDGSNLITKDDLLRINRAAADAPVLPSMLMNPSQESVNGTAEKQTKKQTPIIILNDDDSADMEGISAEDNLIAESQNVGQRVYQRLPVADKPYGYKVGVQTQRGRPDPEVNFGIVNDDLPKLAESIRQQPIFVPEEQQSEQHADAGSVEIFKSWHGAPSQQLDNFQAHAEQSFQQLSPAQEAPSRQFLRNFNPVLSAEAATSTPKSSFHYESNALQPIIFIHTGEQANKLSAGSDGVDGKVQNATPADGAAHAQKPTPTALPRLPLLQYDKDAAQIRYRNEQQLLQQQKQLIQQQQQFLLQQQQQRQQHERLIKQQMDLQRQEKQQQPHQQQQLQEQHQSLTADKRPQQRFQATSQYEQQQQLQQFHKELQQRQPQQQQQLAVHQHYAIYQQHPPPSEYKHVQQQQQFQYGKQQEQQQAAESARRLQQRQQEEEQLRKQQQQRQEEEQQRIQQQQKWQEEEQQRMQQQQKRQEEEQQRIQQQQKWQEEEQQRMQQQQKRQEEEQQRMQQQQKRQEEEQQRIQQQQKWQEEEQVRIQQQHQQQAQYAAQRQNIQQQQKHRQEDDQLRIQQKAQYEAQRQNIQQQQQRNHQQTQQYSIQPPATSPVSKFRTQVPADSVAAPASFDQQSYNYPISAPSQHSAPATPTPHSVVFVTLHAPTLQAQPVKAPTSQPAYTQKSPHEYASAAVRGATTSQHSKPAPPTPPAIVRRPHSGYTFVEVQKSVNIHNKLITEKDGKLVEEHETIYPLPQYAPQQYQQQKQSVTGQSSPQPATAPPQTHKPMAQNPQPAATEAPTNRAELPHTHYPLQYAQQLALIEQGVHPNDYYFVPKDYASLTANPINVQHIDEPEQQEEASSYAHLQQVLPLSNHVQAHAQPQGGHEGEQHPQHYVQYVQQNYAHPVETQQNPQAAPQQTQHSEQNQQKTHQQAPPQPQPHAEEHHPVAEKEIIEQVVTKQVEKIVERPVHIPYPVHVQQYIDRPYPVQEIVETHIPVPYPVPEPVAVPVHVERYIDRPYPVEKIVEKRVPYPVERVVEKIVEKEIPIEVEKVVEKLVDRPVPIPIRVPVAVPVPYAQQPLPEYDENAQLYGPAYHPHPNALDGWSDHSGISDIGGHIRTNLQIPPKVLQNYYTRMLKKLLPHALAQRGTATSTANTVYTHTQARPKNPTASTASTLKTTKQPKNVSPSSSSNKQHSFKIGDIRIDLKPPPPPPTGPEWSKGSRYIYNTLPHDLSVADATDAEQLTETYNGPFAAHNEPYDEFQRWRNGHSLKRSPQFGRNLQMEYGFKPPLVPSVEINDQGIPLNAEEKKTEQ